MSTCSVSDLDAGGTGVLSSKFPLLRIFSMTPPQQPTPFSSPTMPPSSRSEKLLRDALLRDERERQQLSGTNNNSPSPSHRRRHSHAPTPSSKEDYTRGSFLFRTAMSNPRSPSPSTSSFSQGQEQERDREDPPVRRMLFYGGDAEGNNGPHTHTRQSQGHGRQQQYQQSNQYHTRRSSLSASPSPSRHSSASSSPSPSPLCMKRREGLGLTSPNTNVSSIGKANNAPSRYSPTVSSSASTSNSNASHYPHTPQTRIPQLTGYSPSPSHTRTRSQTDPILHPPLSHPNSSSPRSSVTLTTSPHLTMTSTRSNSKPTRKSGGMVPPLPLSLKDREGDLRLLTPPPTPPTPPFLRFSPGSGSAGANGYVPSPSGTPTRIPVSIQAQNFQRKKEGGLETRRPTQGPAAATEGNTEKRQPGGQRQRNVTVTQARATTTGSNLDSRRGHSLASTESCSTRTSLSSTTSNSCSPQPPFAGGVYQSQPNPSPPSSPSTTTTLFNARKASTQCRAIQGYVSFASVEGLGEPPLVGDELDGFGEVDGGKGRTGIPFLPLGAWSAALRWRRFLGGDVDEVSDRNAAHTRTAICVPT